MASTGPTHTCTTPTTTETTRSPRHASKEFRPLKVTVPQRANCGGISLTTAGCLEPADLEEASKVYPAPSDWIGKHNLEVQCYPLLRFGEGVRSLGLCTVFIPSPGCIQGQSADRGECNDGGACGE